MGAEKDGYTFEGWNFNLKKANGDTIGGQLPPGKYTYDFGGDGTFEAQLSREPANHL